jgi:hypothetical protein
MNDVEIEAEAFIYPTEDSEKVEKAIKTVFPACSVTVESHSEEVRILRAREHGKEALIPLQSLLRQDRIRDAARSVLMSSISNNMITFHLNKQVAFVGHISFSMPNAESPLGPITVKIKCENPIRLVEWLAPGSIAVG